MGRNLYKEIKKDLAKVLRTHLRGKIKMGEIKRIIIKQEEDYCKVTSKKGDKTCALFFGRDVESIMNSYIRTIEKQEPDMKFVDYSKNMAGCYWELKN